MPVIDGAEYTFNAIDDCLAQTIPTRVLVINNGSSDANRTRLELLAERVANLSVWSHDPPLPSLAATWNLALEFVWECGGEHALVVNNDVRLHPATYGALLMNRERADALFVSGVGVDDATWERWSAKGDTFSDETASGIPANQRGGPDFSCFLITRECHERYRFDEALVPAYGEDIDTHRRMMLAGDGDRIFGINLPFLHIGGGSRTINQSKAHWDRFERQAAIGRQHYIKSWGGSPNEERYAVKGDPSSARDGVTTPELQAGR